MKDRHLLHAMIAAGVLSVTVPAYAASCRINSPEHTIAVVELYTSEGCSSCPPADRWLGELTGRFSAQQVLPLALHVDYWDYIGWKDVFAKSAFSERQRQLSHFGSSGTIYTPEVFVGMKELRGWHRNDQFEDRIEAINRQPARARIDLQLHSIDTKAANIEVQFAVDATPTKHVAQGIVVLFENKLSTSVRAGENKGASLNHDHVVRYWSTPMPLDAKTGRAVWQQTLPLPAGWNPENLGVAALVEDTTTGEVLQAVSLPICV